MWAVHGLPCHAPGWCLSTLPPNPPNTRTHAHTRTHAYTRTHTCIHARARTYTHISPLPLLCQNGKRKGRARMLAQKLSMSRWLHHTAGEGERVNLQKSKKVRAQVEKWLSEFEGEMISKYAEELWGRLALDAGVPAQLQAP